MHSEISPALGCTEPAAVALACGKAREVLGTIPTTGKIFVSGNIFKNALGVGIPGTGLTGLPIAVALGLTGGKSSDSLEILKSVSQEHMKLAKQLIDNKTFDIQVKDKVHKLYVEVQIENGKDSVITIISHKHNHFSFIKRNGEVLVNDIPTEEKKSRKSPVPTFLSIDSILDFVETVNPKELEIFNKSIELNLAIAQEGLIKDYGLRVGKNMVKTISNLSGNVELARDYAVILTTAACDARMGGSILPVMANTGSGNQGLTTSLPIIAYAEKLKEPHIVLLKSLALGHLISIHMKKKLGPLSALCGVLLAATGAACGITYLQGGNRDAVKRAIKHMAANITGMLCDGAKPGCSLKVHTGITAAIQASELALNDDIEALADGIIEEDVEHTIDNIACIGKTGLSGTDKMIIDMMQNKQKA
jgi:L-cysteine desulfidase